MPSPAPGPSGTGLLLFVGVLGPLEVRLGGRPVEITTGRLRALLAVLAMTAGRPASADRLAGAIWGENLPDDARRSIRTYVTRLRTILGADAIESGPDGYLLHAEVDALSFERLLEREAVAEALALWRGEPFEGIRAVWLEDVEAPRLAERRLDAVERRIELDLAAGAPSGLIGELRDLTARHPLRETFWAQLMVALYRSGRQVEALSTYQILYRLLADEAGVEPGAHVQHLHRRMVRADPALHHRPTDDPVVPVPERLPPGVAGLEQLLPSGDAAAVAVVAGGSWSYAAVGPAAQRLFRLLSAHPGPDIALDAAAGLAGLPIPEARPVLRELCDAHLLTEHTPGRYAMHELLRAYAAELGRQHDGEGDREAAERRLLDHYLTTAGAAAELIEAEEHCDRAVAWFGAELSPILGAVALARSTGRDDEAGRLARSLADYLQWQ
ncbi:BTAD domain-containing putative transcriptional regulator [Actinoplanes sp. CA-142083]|uniref:AfsR/SARP family transcriptional regulator n=1 Tax=Actinoplanes sp. CA-142083 TaxID=3239903 RepID=UPI003D91F2E7